MILTCPECTTRYQTDAAAFAPPGRKVRCAKCGHVWHQVAEPAEHETTLDDPPPPPPPTPAPETQVESRIEPHTDLPPIPPRRTAYVPPESDDTVEDDVTQQRTPGSSWAFALGWLALIAIVLVIGWSAVVYRQEVATLWPQSASLYAKFGLDVNSRGIAFVDVTYKREMEDGQFVLAVTGRLVNVSQREIPVPQIRATLVSGDKRELYHWNFTARVATLHPGEAVPFLSRVSNPPSAARHIQLRFVENGG